MPLLLRSKLACSHRLGLYQLCWTMSVCGVWASLGRSECPVLMVCPGKGSARPPRLVGNDSPGGMSWLWASSGGHGQPFSPETDVVSVFSDRTAACLFYPVWSLTSFEPCLCPCKDCRTSVLCPTSTVLHEAVLHILLFHLFSAINLVSQLLHAPDLHYPCVTIRWNKNVRANQKKSC